MKYFKSLSLFVFLSFACLGLLTYTSCNEDDCKEVQCQNEGTCFNGVCNCPTAYTGDRCQFEIRLSYDSTYRGTGWNDSLPPNLYVNYALVFKPIGTSPTAMSLKILDSNGTPSIIRDSLTLKLNTNTTFILDQKQQDSSTYTGTGIITVDTAWLYIKRVEKRTFPDTTYITNYTFEKMRRR